MDDYGHWETSAVGSFDPADWVGFIYTITNKTTGRSYIGKKVFRNKKRLPPLKGKTRARLSNPESKWRTYQSSCKELQEDIQRQGEDAFTFTIVKLCSGKCEMSYSEEEMQFRCDVLRARLPSGEKMWYNGTIAYKNYGGIEKQTDESKQKMALISHS